MKKKIAFWASCIILLIASIVYAATWQSYSELASGSIADGDDVLIRDVSDLSMDASGTVKRYAWSSIKDSLPLGTGFAVNGLTASDDFLIFKAPIDLTVKAIHGVLQSGTNVVGGFDECDSNGANCVAIDSDITFNGGDDADDGSLSNASIDAGDWIRWHTTSVSSPGYFTVRLTFK